MTTKNETKTVRRVVPADLIEATPSRAGLGNWVLASPLILFLAWLWIDLFHYFVGPTANYRVNALIALVVFGMAIVLPLGYGAHRLVLALPRLFHNAGWEIKPLEAVPASELYLVRYRYQTKHWAANSWSRAWLRAAQGWVFLEMATILIGAIVMIPLFFSAREFGFGQ